MAERDDDPQEREPLSVQNTVAASGVGATAAVAIASILLSLGTDGLSVILAAVGVAVAGTLGALGRRKR